MLVGTATTGQSTSPPTTLGNAPSIPATTTIASASVNRSRYFNSRWIPATPTSATNSTAQPNASAVTAASLATGKSLVPAVSTNTRPWGFLSSPGLAAGSQNVRATRS